MAAVGIILLAAAVAGAVYQLAAALLVRRFAACGATAPRSCPPVIILKPLCGAEPGLLDNLSSFLAQPWPSLRMVCGVRDGSDPAVAVVAQLQARHPQADIRLVVGTRTQAANAKVANLMSMLPEADDGVVIIADSDMRVGTGYVSALVGALETAGVGLATCLYVGRPQSDVWSRLGAMGINYGFLPSALLAHALGRRDGCFGATIALRRDVLDRIGGFAACRDQLADDYALGRAVRRHGLAIALVPVLVDAQVHERGFRGLLAHEVRWGRTIATLAPLSYVGSVVTQPVALALLGTLAAGRPPESLAVLAAALACRFGAVRVIDRALGTRAPLGLLPLRDLLSFAVFVAAFCGRSVRWRGRRYRIVRDGTLIPLSEAGP